MAPMALLEMHENGLYGGIGPHPSFVQVAKPFVFEQTVQRCRGDDEARETASRMQGVQWIDGVRKALNLPVRTFMTAVVYYHRFRLAHVDADYLNVDAAAAALFTACKIEDTLKKSRDILCAAHNLKASGTDHLTPDDPIFEEHSKRLLGLERLMLESSGFDFRNRNPQQWVIKFIRLGQFDRDTVGKTAYRICLDVYRTYGPLKQTSSTIALACVELAARLHEASTERFQGLIGNDRTMTDKWGTSRAEVMETLLDLLELYTHYRASTAIGPEHSIETFIAIRITLNKEATAADLPRFTEFVDLPNAPPKANGQAAANGSSKPTPTSPANPLSAPTTVQQSPAAVDPSTATASPATNKPRQPDRRDGTVRYMLDSARAHAERDAVDAHFKEEWEEYEEVIERPAKPLPPQRSVAAELEGNNHHNHHNHRRPSRSRSPARRGRPGPPPMQHRYRDDRGYDQRDRDWRRDKDRDNRYRRR